MLNRKEKDHIKEKLIHTGGGITSRSSLVNFLEQNGSASPNRFADSPGFECSALLREQLAELFVAGQPKYNLPDGAWIAALKSQMIYEIENDDLIVTEKVSDSEKMDVLTKLGAQHIEDYFHVFKKNITLQANELNDCESEDQIKAKLQEIIKQSFPKRAFVEHIHDFYHLPNMRELVEKVLNKDSKEIVSTMVDALSIITGYSPLLKLITETVKFLKNYKPNPETHLLMVSIGSALYKLCEQFAQKKDTDETVQELVGLLRGYKNATKPSKAPSLWTNKMGCREFSDSLRNVLKQHSPVNYKKVKQDKPDMEVVKRIGSLRDLRAVPVSP